MLLNLTDKYQHNQCKTFIQHPFHICKQHYLVGNVDFLSVNPNNWITNYEATESYTSWIHVKFIFTRMKISHIKNEHHPEYCQFHVGFSIMFCAKYMIHMDTLSVTAAPWALNWNIRFIWIEGQNVISKRHEKMWCSLYTSCMSLRNTYSYLRFRLRMEEVFS